MAFADQLGAQQPGDWWSANLPQISEANSNLGQPVGGNVGGQYNVPQMPKTGGGDTQQQPQGQGGWTLPPPPANWPQEWKELYTATGGTGGINPPWLNKGGGGFGGTPQGQQAPPQGQGGQDVQAFIQNWQATHSPSEGIEGLAAALKAAGLGGERFMYGNTPSNNELVVNGQKFKVLGGEGTPAAYWYKPGTNDAPGGGAGQFGTGSLAQGYSKEFAGPTREEFENSPGYQFARDQGLQGVQRSAAARGTLLTGGTLKDLAQYGVGLADQTYGDAFNRSGQTFDRNYNVWRNSGNDIFNRYFNLSQLGAQSASGAAS